MKGYIITQTLKTLETTKVPPWVGLKPTTFSPLLQLPLQNGKDLKQWYTHIQLHALFHNVHFMHICAYHSAKNLKNESLFLFPPSGDALQNGQRRMQPPVSN